MKCKHWALAICFATNALLCGALNAQVTWDTPGSGNWQDGVNWSTGNVPQPTDDVVIDQGGGFLVTIGASIPAMNSIFSNEDILLSGGDLVLANGGTINGELTLGTNLDLTSNGGVFTATGITVLDGGNVFADGSTMNLNTVASYLTDTGTNSSRTIRGRNGSSIDLSGLSDLSGGGFIRTLNVNAESGSTIDLSSLTNYLGGSTRFVADGVGSSVDVSSLGSFANTNNNIQAWLRATDGGTINANSLTSISSGAANGSLFVLDGATSTINANLLTEIVNTQAQLTNGGVHDFSAITNFLGSNAFVDSGSAMDLTAVTSYDTNGGGNGSRTFQAMGAGSSIDLSNVASVVGGSFIRKLNIDSSDGGTIDLSGLTDITSGAVEITADGAGSLVDISSLQNFNDDNGNIASSIIATNGGEVRLDTNVASNLSFDGVNVTIDGTGLIDTSRIVNYRGGIFTVSTVNQSLTLADATSSSFIANSGSEIDVSSLTGTVENTGQNFTVMNFEANGAGSLVNISGVTQLSYDTTSVNPNFNLTATDGGQVDASAIENLIAAGGIINSNRAITVTADGAGSSVDLSSVTTFSDTGSNTESAIIATNGGVVELGAGALTLTNVNLMVDTGGTINGGILELLSVNTNSSGAPDDFSTVSGNGVITADIINTSGVLAPGNSPGSLTIDGDYTQMAGGLMEIEINSVSLFDMIEITGDAMFDGLLNVVLDPGFDLQNGDSFQIVSVGANSSGTFSGLMQDSIVLSDNGFDLRINYFGGDGNDIVLLASSVPEPGSIGFLAALALVGTMRRRRRDV